MAEFKDMLKYFREQQGWSQPTDAPQNKKSPDLHEAKPRLIDIRHEDNLILPLGMHP